MGCPSLLHCGNPDLHVLAWRTCNTIRPHSPPNDYTTAKLAGQFEEPKTDEDLLIRLLQETGTSATSIDAHFLNSLT